MDGGDSCSGFLDTTTTMTTTAESRSQAFDQLVRTLGLEDQCGSAGEADDPQLADGGPLAVDGDSGVPARVLQSPSAAAASEQVVQVGTAMVGAVGLLTGKRRRGRPPKGQTAAPKPPPPKNTEEEDVCFICFDGGSLVLCDRKGCPKAYHPACIKRDEAFFRSKAKWNCGWHICSVCQKAAHYMCYTCTYSLCKGCTKDAEYVCVRGNKGFCTTCMRTIMLIENKDTGNKEMVQVDFDDKTSWEYLFKVYWILLKDNLSLTINELMQAKSPWKGVVMMDQKQQSPKNSFVNGSTVSISDKASENLELNMSEEPFELPCHDSVSTEQISSDNGIKLVECKDWASKELLELVAHMKNGDTSVLSLFEVQSLLLEYIKCNNLRDPRRKSQIICDLRLRNMFGKPRVGHIEMLKLLEYHFLIKEDNQKNAFIPAAIVGSVAGHTGADEHSNLMIDITRKRKTRKKGEEKAPQTNLDEFAAIDVHNISLIYLRRDLMESLFGDEENFHDKVVGSIVRIRVSSNDQKQDIYRLVQVVGTSKADEPFKLVDKTTDVFLEVLNLDKKETVSIDAISNQDFSQEECRRLRQSIRCGLVKRFTVGEIQMKAMALQALRLNDVLEAEILRLNHLRDRANEQGRKKELRECVEKLQRLKMPEERQRRLTEIPEVHADPKMSPNYESEEDVAASCGQKKDDFSRSKRPKFNNNGSQSIPPKAKEECTKKAHCSNEKLDEKHEIQVPVSNPESSWGNQAVVKTSSANFSTGSPPSVNISEVDRMWHYRDPNGKVQGPFAMMQLRKWSTTGYFPTDMRIWTINELNGSLLLADALNGRSTVHQVRGNESEEIKSLLDERSQSSHETQMHETTSEQSFNSSSSQTYASQSSGPNLRPLSLNLDLNQKDTNSNVASMTSAPNDMTEQHSDTNMLDLPSPTPKINIERLEGQAIENQRLDVPVQDAGIPDLPTSASKPLNESLSSPASKEMQENLGSNTIKPTSEVLPSSSKPDDGNQGKQIAESNQSVPSKVSVPESGPSWSSSLAVGGSQFQEVPHEWSGYPPTAPKSSVAEWDSRLVSMASEKPTSVLGDQVAIPNLNTNILPHSPSSLPASNISSWQAVGHEPIEFSTLAEESVSDLLAEVLAMESQRGLASPTSGIKCSDEMMDSCKNDCFSSIEELSPTPDAGKSDAVSSGEVQFPSQSPVADDPGVDSQADIFDPLKRSDGHSATSSEGETRSADTSLNRREAASDIHPPAGCTTNQGTAPTPMTRGRGLESIDTGWSGLQGNMHMGWGGSPQGFPNIGWGSGLGAPWGNPNFNLGAYNGSLGWDSPRRYGAERFAGPRDWGFQGADAGYGRGRPVWSRQPHGSGSGSGGGGGGGGSGGGGGYSRAPSKGQRVCKFYESGHCKKGASCDYLHP